MSSRTGWNRIAGTAGQGTRFPAGFGTRGGLCRRLGLAGLSCGRRRLLRGGNRVVVLDPYEGDPDPALEIVVGDAADESTAQAAAERAEELAPLAGWVNNAAVSLYGRATHLPIAEMRRQMDINYWGQVYGSLTAVRHLRGHGGALINVGSALSDRAIPLQGNYCAAKHAVQGFCESLRSELLHDGKHIRITMVQLPALNTPRRLKRFR